MSPRRLHTPVLRALLPLLLLAACAKPKRTVVTNPSAEVVVAVTNDQSPPAAVSVYMLSEDGSRRLLGTVPPASNRTFRYAPVSNTGQFRLVAQTAGESDIASQPFTLARTSAVSWSLRNNIIQFLDQ
ncbi:MAG TPA: hypothetical protein VF041_01855 [Gemmatimonadaceae bacterium]